MANVGGAQPFRLKVKSNGGARYRPQRPRVRPVRPIAPRVNNGGAQPFVAPKPVQANSNQAPPGQSPLDSEYFNSRNQAQFQANQRIAGLNAQSGYDRTALSETLRQLGERQPVVRQQATNSANSQGLLYSGALGSQIGDLEKQYLQNQSTANDQFARAEAARQAEIASIQGNLGFDDLAAQFAAIDRSAERLASAPAPPVASAPGKPPRVAKKGPGRPRQPQNKPKPSPKVRKR